MYEMMKWVIPGILNSLITAFIIYKFMRVLLGIRVECKKVSFVLYILFFVLKTVLMLNQIILIVPYLMGKYFDFVLYIILFALIMGIALCYKPTFKTGFGVAVITAISLYASRPISKYIFDSAYRFIVPDFSLIGGESEFRHICYLVFEQYQAVSVLVVEITVKLLFLMAIIHIKHIYEERNMYYMQVYNKSEDDLELRQLRHDLKNHIGALNQMLISNDMDMARVYLLRLGEISENKKLFCDTENVAIDSIINYKLHMAEEKNIECTLDIVIPKNLNISDEDAVIILGNLLDNAIEACLKLEDKRYINVTLSYKCGLLFVVVSNSYNGIIKKNGKGFTSLKADKSLHGLGLKNIQNVLKRYNGTFETEITDNEFKAKVVMYIKF